MAVVTIILDHDNAAMAAIAVDMMPVRPVPMARHMPAMAVAPMKVSMPTSPAMGMTAAAMAMAILFVAVAMMMAGVFAVAMVVMARMLAMAVAVVVTRVLLMFVLADDDGAQHRADSGADDDWADIAPAVRLGGAAANGDRERR